MSPAKTLPVPAPSAATIHEPGPSAPQRKVKKTPRAHAVRTAKYLLLILFLLVVLIPAYVMVVTSFKSFSEALSPNRWALPHLSLIHI